MTAELDLGPIRARLDCDLNRDPAQLMLHASRQRTRDIAALLIEVDRLTVLTADPDNARQVLGVGEAFAEWAVQAANGLVWTALGDEARARNLLTSDEFVQPGDVLVCKRTYTSEWVPVGGDGE